MNLCFLFFRKIRFSIVFRRYVRKDISFGNWWTAWLLNFHNFNPQNRKMYIKLHFEFIYISMNFQIYNAITSHNFRKFYTINSKGYFIRLERHLHLPMVKTIWIHCYSILEKFFRKKKLDSSEFHKFYLAEKIDHWN